jgi:hypothetical protein
MKGTGRGRADPGVAMVTTTVLVAMISALVTAGLLTSRSDLVLFRNLRDGTSTYYRTHGAMTTTVANIAAGYTFDSVLAGPDGVAGTADDGEMGAMTDCDIHAMDDAADPDPHRLVDANQRIRLVGTCLGPRHARRSIELIVRRDPAPLVPAALLLGRPRLDATASVTLDGGDHLPGDAAGAPSGNADPVPAAASADLDEPTLLPYAVRTGRGGRVAAVPTVQIDRPEFAGRLLSLGLPPVAGLSEATLAGLITHTGGSARVSSAVRGRGLLIIDGDLEVTAPLTFSGVLVVQGTLDIRPGGALAVRGSLWVWGEGLGAAVEAAGPLTVAYSRDAVAQADRAFRLPRRALGVAQREVFDVF